MRRCSSVGSEETERLAALVRSLVAQRTSRAVVVVGGSGSGKSSLVRAGLVPRLVAEGWITAPPVLPGPEPLRALALSIGRAWRRLDAGQRIELAELSERIVEDLDGVAAELLLAAPSTSQGLLLVVDQLEEVFTRASSDAATTFLRLLDQASEAGRSTAVVATLRSEFVGELLAADVAGQVRACQFPLAPLDRARLAGIVRGPARKGRLELSDDLVERLVEDTGTGDALPLLAYVLRLLTERARPGDRISLAQYERFGGVQGALRAQADDALDRAVASTGHGAGEILDALVGLVSLDDAGRPTRRRLARSSVPRDLLDAFDVLVDARLVSSDEVDGETQLAATHEALFTAWPQLADAIASRAERLQLRRRLEQAAAEWERVDHDPSILWRGGPLRAARAPRSMTVAAGRPVSGSSSRRPSPRISRAGVERRTSSPIASDRPRSSSATASWPCFSCSSPPTASL